MSKFHINTKDGTVGLCKATKGQCPFGGESEHYPSIVEAAKGYELMMNSETINTVSKNEMKIPFVSVENYEVSKETLRGRDFDDFIHYDSQRASDYLNLRNSAGPVVTHKEARDIAYTIKLIRENPALRRKFSEETLGNEDDFYDISVQFIKDNYKDTLYHTLYSSKELEENIWENLNNAINAKRPFGFPEDEMTRYQQNANEKGYVEALKTLTGLDETEVRRIALNKEYL